MNTKYQVIRQIGAGSFGAIFEVQNAEGEALCSQIRTQRSPASAAKVTVPVNTGDIARGAKSNSKAANCMQPLPFFTSIHQAASFMGRSKRFAERKSDAEEGQEKPDINQDMFLFQRKARIPKNPVILEFEPAVRPGAE
jgi:hypothetical protein